jgi:hypothetical protein
MHSALRPNPGASQRLRVRLIYVLRQNKSAAARRATSKPPVPSGRAMNDDTSI